MILIPAVDVRGGRCVRLLRGDYRRETVYGDDPEQCVLDFVRHGARRVHVVDLDAARGHPDVLSRDAMRAAVRAAVREGVVVQVGGGVRSRAAADAWLSMGANYVVLGSLALREPDLAEAICAFHPGGVLLGLDVRDGVAQAEGWTVASGAEAEHVTRWRRWNAAGVIRTEVGRDGALAGPDLAGLAACVAAYGGDVVASGGIASLEDLDACAAAGAAGAIVGRAIYERRIDLAAALERHSTALARSRTEPVP